MNNNEPSIVFRGIIKGTNLNRRFQEIDGEFKEISPIYITPKDEIGSHGQATESAFSQATSAGYRGVKVDGVSYVNFGGVWYVF